MNTDQLIYELKLDLSKKIRDYYFLEILFYDVSFLRSIYHDQRSGDKYNSGNLLIFGDNTKNANIVLAKEYLRGEYVNGKFQYAKDEYGIYLFLNLGRTNKVQFYSSTVIGIYGNGKYRSQELRGDEIERFSDKITSGTSKIYSEGDIKYFKLKKLLLESGRLFDDRFTTYSRVSFVNGVSGRGNYKKIFTGEDVLENHLLSIYG